MKMVIIIAFIHIVNILIKKGLTIKAQLVQLSS